MSGREDEPTREAEDERQEGERADDPGRFETSGPADGHEAFGTDDDVRSGETTYGLDDDPAVDPGTGTGTGTTGGHDVVEVIRNGERTVRSVPAGEGDDLAERWERQVKKRTMMRILLGAVIGTAIFGYGVLSARLLMGAAVTGVISVFTWFSLPDVEIGVIARNASTEEAGRYVDEARESRARSAGRASRTGGAVDRVDGEEGSRWPPVGQVVTWLVAAGILGYGILSGQFLLAALVVSVVALVERLTWG